MFPLSYHTSRMVSHTPHNNEPTLCRNDYPLGWLHLALACRYWICMAETWEHVSVHWQLGNYPLWARYIEGSILIQLWTLSYFSVSYTIGNLFWFTRLPHGDCDIVVIHIESTEIEQVSMSLNWYCRIGSCGALVIKFEKYQHFRWRHTEYLHWTVPSRSINAIQNAHNVGKWKYTIFRSIRLDRGLCCGLCQQMILTYLFPGTVKCKY